MCGPQVRWTDGGLPKRLCLRVQEAGWLWSGGIALNSPGDLFVKIRHRRARPHARMHRMPVPCCQHAALNDRQPPQQPRVDTGCETVSQRLLVQGSVLSEDVEHSLEDP